MFIVTVITVVYTHLSCYTVILKHKWTEEMDSFRHFTTEKSHYTLKYTFPNMTALSQSAATIQHTVTTYFISISPSGHWRRDPSIKRLLGWIALCLSVRCVVRKHVTSITPALLLWLWPHPCLSHSVTSPICDLSGAISGPSLCPGNLVASSRFNSWPVMRRLS